MPKIFGIEHFLYILVFTILSICSIMLILKRKKDERFIRKVVIFAAITNLVLVICNRLSVCAKFDWDYRQLYPTTFCGTVSFVFPIALLVCKKDSNVLHFISYCAFFGGLLTLIYPDFIGQSNSIFYPATITGLLHHSAMLYNFLLIVLSGYFVPSIKKIGCLSLGLCALMTLGIFNITILGYDDSMYIFHELISGTIFSWFFVGIIFILLHAIFLLIFDFCKNKDQSVLKKVIKSFQH